MTGQITLAVVVSIISVVMSAYFGFRNAHKEDTKAIEKRVEDNTKINIKLDNICLQTSDIKSELTQIKEDIKVNNDRLIKVEESCKSAHHRLDTLEGRINTGE